MLTRMFDKIVSRRNNEQSYRLEGFSLYLALLFSHVVSLFVVLLIVAAVVVWIYQHLFI